MIFLVAIIEPLAPLFSKIMSIYDKTNQIKEVDVLKFGLCANASRS
jgi:hypothetical protein